VKEKKNFDDVIGCQPKCLKHSKFVSLREVKTLLFLKGRYIFSTFLNLFICLSIMNENRFLALSMICLVPSKLSQQPRFQSVDSLTKFGKHVWNGKDDG